MIVVMKLLSGKSLHVEGFPLEVQLGGDMVGFLPVFPDMETAEKHYPDGTFVPIDFADEDSEGDGNDA